VCPNVPGVAKKIANMIREADEGVNEAMLRQKYQTDGSY